MAGRIRPQQVAIVGSGSIGSGWAIVLARAGYRVVLNDVAEAQLEKAAAVMEARLAEIDDYGLLPDAAATIAERIRYEADLGRAVAGADLVIEAAPETLDLKRALFEWLMAATHDRTVLASSSSAITVKRFTNIPATRAIRCSSTTRTFACRCSMRSRRGSR